MHKESEAPNPTQCGLSGMAGREVWQGQVEMLHPSHSCPLEVKLGLVGMKPLEAHL